MRLWQAMPHPRQSFAVLRDQTPPSMHRSKESLFAVIALSESKTPELAALRAELKASRFDDASTFWDRWLAGWPYTDTTKARAAIVKVKVAESLRSKLMHTCAVCSGVAGEVDVPPEHNHALCVPCARAAIMMHRQEPPERLLRALESNGRAFVVSKHREYFCDYYGVPYVPR